MDEWPVRLSNYWHTQQLARAAMIADERSADQPFTGYFGICTTGGIGQPERSPNLPSPPLRSVIHVPLLAYGGAVRSTVASLPG